VGFGLARLRRQPHRFPLAGSRFPFAFGGAPWKIGEMSTMAAIPPGTLACLRPARPDDAGIIAEFKRDPLVRRMALGRGHASTEEEEREQILAALSSEREDYYVIVDRSDEQPVGYVRLNWREAGRRFAWLRFALGRRRGRGLARDALATLLAHLFATGTHRIDAEVYAVNDRSRKLLDGLGFVREGTKREARFDGEGYTDVIAYGLLAPDLRVP
jgi:RimJ/RimL family protein N-acetyltransferase